MSAYYIPYSQPLAKILSTFYELEPEWSQLLTGESSHISVMSIAIHCPS